MAKKRYQYYSKNGIIWTDWFRWDCSSLYPWQLKNKLLNEYKDEDICTSNR